VEISVANSMSWTRLDALLRCFRDEGTLILVGVLMSWLENAGLVGDWTSG